MIASVIHPHCIKVLPTEYSNSLSYYEELCQFRKKLNEVIEVFNEYESVILELQEALTNISSMQSDIANIKNRLLVIDGLLETLQNEYLALQQVDANQQVEIDDLKARLDSVITSYNSIIEYVDNAIRTVSVENSTAWIRLENYINTQDRLLQLQIDELRKAIEGIVNNVYNPIRGYRENLDENNRDIYADLRYGGFTNAELSEFGISNDHVASLIVDNRDYALNAKKRFKRHYIFSPVTGNRTAHSNAISQALALVTNGLSNDAFAELDLTNDEVVALDLTNIQKFLYNPNGQPSGDGSYIKYDENLGVGLTVEQYEGLFVGN